MASFHGLKAKGGWTLGASFVGGRTASPINVSAPRVQATLFPLRVMVPNGWQQATMHATTAGSQPTELCHGDGWVEIRTAAASELQIWA